MNGVARSALDRMDFEPSPDQRRLMDLATAFATGAGATLPADATDFATEAHAGIGARGLFSTKPTLDAALVTMTLARASPALGAVFASGWLFLDALRRYGAGTTVAGVAAGAEAGLRAGAVVLAHRRREQPEIGASEIGGVLTLIGTSAPSAFVPIAGDAIVGGRLGSGDGVLACVDLSARGVSKGPPLPALGLEGVPRGTVELRRVEVPAERILVRGSAAATAARALDDARSILWAAVAVGIAGRALDYALSHVRGLGKVPQSTEFMVSDLATAYDAAHLVTAQAAFMRDGGEAVDERGASAKLLAARSATQVCHGALSVCGEGGYDDELRRAYVDARHLELYDGTEAEQIDVIASRMLGES